MRKISKLSEEEIKEILPKNIDPKIFLMARGFAEWGIPVQEIQCLALPWVIIPAGYSERVSALLTLWNNHLKSEKKWKKIWVIIPSGDKYIIAHPIKWESDGEPLSVCQELGRFLSNLPRDALTEKGYETLSKT